MEKKEPFSYKLEQVKYEKTTYGTINHIETNRSTYPLNPAVYYKENTLYSWNNFPILATISLIVFVSSALTSIVAPFFPKHAEKEFHASSFEIGLVFTTFQFSIMFMSPLASMFCSKYGRFPIMMIGQVIIGITCILIGYGKNIYLIIFIRIIQGIGSAMINVAAIAIAMSTFPENTADVMGITEGSIGLGFACGPMVGSVLYYYGGFNFTFIFIGIIPIILLYPMFIFARKIIRLKKEKLEKKISDNHTSNISSNDGENTLSIFSDEPIEFRDLLNKYSITALFAATISMACFGYIDPLLEIHLDSILGLSQNQIGIAFSLIAGVYTLVCPFVGRMMRFVRDDFFVMEIGFYIMALSLFLLSSPPFLNSLLFDNYTWTIYASQLFGIIFFGIGAALSFIPSLPIMQESVSEYGNDAVDYMMGLYTSASFLGEGIGPMISSLLKRILPETQVVHCNPLKAINKCKSTFSWATITFAMFILFCNFFIKYRFRHKRKIINKEKKKNIYSYLHPNKYISSQDDDSD